MTTTNPPAGSSVTARPDSLTLLFFAIIVLLGGSNFVAVRFTVMELPPFWSAALRFFVAAVLFWLIAAANREKLPRGRDLRDALIAGVLGIGSFYALTYWALSQIPAGLASILAAVGPLATFLLAFAHGMERFRFRAITGAMIALAGIGVSFFRLPEGTIQLLPAMAMLLGVVFASEGSLILKRLKNVSPVMANGLGMTVGAAILGIISLVAGEPWGLPSRPETWIALIYLILFGSVGLFYLLVLLLRRWTASGTTYAFVMFPFVAVTLGAILAGEPLTAGLFIGATLVLLGVWVGALSRGKAKTSAISTVQPLDGP